MKLDRLVVENFRQYYGRHRIDFARDDQRCVTVIHGANGAGKTSLFTAISWCLYGEGASNIGELLSKEAASRARTGEPVEASVELSFLHDGERYHVRRALHGTKDADGKVEIAPRENFTMMRTLWDGQAEEVHNPVGKINSILPSNVRAYFLFDGEKIDNFAKPEAGHEIKDAVFLVLKLEVISRATTSPRIYRELADQLVLFVTDEELREQARQNLEPRIGAEYRLEFNPATSCTEIVEVNA